MNIKLILEKVRKYLNSSNQISYDEFEEAFGILGIQEQYLVCDLLRQNDIILVNTKTPEYAEHKISNIKKNDKKVILNKLNSLNNEQLCIEYQHGNKAALYSLIAKNKKYIMKQIFNRGKFYNHKFEDDDLEQIANIGLMNAAKKFDYIKYKKFLTYATFWINHSLDRNIKTNGFLIRLPLHIWDSMGKISKIEKENIGLSPQELKMLILASGITKDKYDFIQRIKRNFISHTYLDAYTNGESEQTLMEIISNDLVDSYKSVEEVVEEKNMISDVKKIMNFLSEKERNVLIERYGINDNGVKKTLQEIGYSNGVTRERVRQIENRAIAKLKAYCKRKNLNSLSNYLDEIIVRPKNQDNNKIYKFEKNGASYIPSQIEIARKIFEVNNPDTYEQFLEYYKNCAKLIGYKLSKNNDNYINYLYNRIKKEI